MDPKPESRFIHLRTRSHYSLLNGLSKIDPLVKKAKKLGMNALALTDAGGLYGAIEFYKACKSNGIKPIIGVEVIIAPRTRFDKEPRIDTKRLYVTLLAKNDTGYRNLLKLVSYSYLEGFYYKPRIDRELFKKYGQGLVCLSGNYGGEIPRALSTKNFELAEKLVREYQSYVGKEDFFLEIGTRTTHPQDKDVRAGLIELSKKTGVPLVGTHGSCYLEKDDHDAFLTLLQVQNSHDEDKTIDQDAPKEDLSFIGDDEAAEYFKDIPEAITNTHLVAERCNLELELGKFTFPEFPIPPGETADGILKKLAYEGLKFRGLENSDAAKKRLDYELEIIAMKKYASYFLVVEDLIRYAREKNIYTNIRGSVAGSITTYALQITKIDPLEYNIPFERFLNPERPSAPDIDMDFADNRREEMIDYARAKYGEDKVSHIGTFGAMMAKGSVRDVARALGYPYEIGDRISKLIPLGSQGFPMTIDTALSTTPELKSMYEGEPDVKRIIDLAKKIEGCVRHVSVHAAGIVISPKPLIEYAPMQNDPKGGKLITQYDMYSVGEDGVGLTKFDFLGIRNLSILADSVDLVERIYKKKIDIEKIPLDDPGTFEMLARGETEGLFQLNGDGMTRFLKDLKPTAIHDINAMVALYRPGPMQFIPDYIARKHDASLISYLDPVLEPILKQTYGILVYQDDLLIMAHDLAGYTWGEVDKFRKAVGKKIPAEMAAQKDKFIKGCMEHQKWSLKKATQIWTWIEPFAAYGFNKAHSASYGRVAYQTAFMKANFPVAYMSAILTAESGDTEKIAEIIAECKRMNIPVLPPNVQESFGGFTVVRDENMEKIRFGLFTIKNLGTDIAQALIDEREKAGRFSSYSDFLRRIKHKNLNKKSLEALIKSGAMDSLGERGSLMGNIEEALNYRKCVSEENSMQDSLFGKASHEDSPLRLKEAPPATKEEKLLWEKELLGLFISGHPLDKWKAILEKREVKLRDVKERYKEGMLVVIGCIIEEIKPVVTKSGERMVFLKLADFTGTLEAVVFPRTYNENHKKLVVDACVAVKGKISERNGERSLIVEEIRSLG